MAEMGLGYGSEFQLMRFLGHHRNYLNRIIQNSLNNEGTIEWLDFPVNDNRCSGDGEWRGIKCFEGNIDNYNDIKAKWEKFWPQTGSSMNWDGVFKIGDTWFFVEAKAHREESFQKCSASSVASIELIKKSLNDTQRWLEATSPTILKTQADWLDSNCYQLANRLAFLYFCNQCGIKAKLVYIGFVNGYRRKKDEVLSVDGWMKIWEEEMEILGLDIKEMSPYISFVHPDCVNPQIV